MKRRALLLPMLATLALLLCAPVSLAEGQNGTTLSSEVTLAPHWTRTYAWTIGKNVSPATWDFFPGDTGTSTYTVTVTRDDGTYDAWVTGVVTVTNGGDVDTAGLQIFADVTNPRGSVTYASGSVDVSGNPILQPGEKGEYFYSIRLSSPTPGTTYKVTAHVAITNHSGSLGMLSGPDPSASAVWPGEPTSINDSVVVDDTNGMSWTFPASGSRTYARTFSADDEGVNPNTATIKETGQSASAAVTVNVYSIGLADPNGGPSLSEDTSFTRTWLWSIQKSADQTALTLAPGQQFLVKYQVALSTTSEDSDWAVTGNVYIDNDTPIRATVNSVNEVISPDIAAGVVWDGDVDFPCTLAPGEHIEGTYSASLPNADARTATLTVTLQNYSYDAEGNRTASGTTDLSATANVSFDAAAMTPVDDWVSVNDSLQGDLGEVPASQAPRTFSYSRLVGPYAQSGTYAVDNTAAFVANTTQTTKSSTWSIAVTVPSMGATLTPGYWKTHSLFGPAPYDDAWALLGEGTSFYSSGKTCHEVLWTPPAGNAYYNLSYQYIVAKLNILNGADPSAVKAQMAWAHSFFATASPATVLSKPVRAQVIATAAVLSDYNAGIIGPGHASE